jgi:hypothetical protein
MASPVDAVYPQGNKTPSCECRQVRYEPAPCIRHEGILPSQGTLQQRLADLRAHFEVLRSDGRAQPGHEPRRRNPQGPHRRLDHTAR